jgi:phenylpyruvate tautomerase PptA (4-oxalocrotonate tautomerase family)
LIQVKLIEDVFTDAQKRDIAEKLTTADVKAVAAGVAVG